MRVKKFEAKSMKEALTMVKKELGPDAVILSARDNRKSYGIGGEASVEITAAVSESTLQKKQFTESRMTATDRERFARSDARTQRKIIETMVENRLADQTREEQIRRPITSTSYIDIPDEESQQSSRRSSAFDRAAGRMVSDLLNDFENGIDSNAPQQAAAARRQAPQAAAQPAQGVGDRAMARIRNAAREAWSNNPFVEDEQQAPKPAPRSQAPAARQQAARATAPQQAAAPRAASSQSSGYTRASGTGSALARPITAAERYGLNDGGADMIQETDSYAFTQPAQSIPAQQAHVPQALQQTGPDVEKLQGEIQRLQQMIEGFQKVPQTITTLHPGAEFGVSYEFSFMYQKLIEAGVSAEYTVEILKTAQKEIDPMQAKKRPIVDAWVARWFLTHVQTQATPFAGRVHLFVGGSSSGKTSALVKMAAHLVVKEKKKVAVLSTDSGKVGAVDQMKIYCQILNVPFAVIRNKSDWEWVMSQLRHVDHILVDYPGSQLREIDDIQHLKSLLPPESVGATTHLCVSATSKDGDVDELVRRYKAVNPSDLIFTNLDQSVQHGIIYNLHRKTGLPLHSFGIGHRIPEDFEAATKERVLDLIFKITKLKRETA